MRSRATLWDMRAGVRLYATLVLALAFVLQGYVAQSHLHAPQAAQWSADRVLEIVSGNFGHPAKRLPANSDPGKCPTCQATAHGQFLAPSAAAAILPILTVSTIALSVEAIRLVDRISHSWQGRAPPKA